MNERVIPEDLREWYVDTQIRERAWESCVVRLLIERIADQAKQINDRCLELEKQKADLQAKLEERQEQVVRFYSAAVTHLQAELQRLRTENAALKRPVTDEEWRSARAKLEAEHNGNFRCGQDIADTVFASRSQEAQCRHLRKDTHPATRDIWICLDCGVNQDGSQEAQKGAAE